MQPKWYKVGPSLYRAPVCGGWLYRDTMNTVSYYEPDPEREKDDMKRRFGGVKGISSKHQMVYEGT